PMGSRGRMAGQRFSVTQIDQTLEKPERVVELLAGLKPSLDPKGHQRAGPAAEIFLRERMIRAFRKSRVVDPRNPAMVAQKFGYASAIPHVALDPQGNRFDSLEQQKRAQGRQHGAGGPLVDTAAARNVRGLFKMVDVHETVIGGIRAAEHGETFGVLLPGKPAAVDNDTAECRAVPAHELRQRMHHNVCAVGDRPQQDRRGDRIVDDQRNAVAVGYVSERLDITNVSRWITDTFAKYRSRLVIEQLFYRLGLIRLRKADVDSLTPQNVGEQCVRSSGKLRTRNDVAAELRDVERRVIERRLACADAQRLEPSLERGDAPL